MLKQTRKFLGVRTCSWGEFGLIGLAVVIFGCVMGALQLRDHNRLVALGVVLPSNSTTVTGVVTDKPPLAETSPRHLLGYEFQTEDGETYSSTTPVTEAFYQLIEIGMEVRVRYSQEDPTASRLQGRSFPMFMLSLALAAVGAGLFCCSFVLGKEALHETNRLLFLQDSGLVEKAHVVRHIRACGDDDNEIYYKLVWRDQSGRLGMSTKARSKCFFPAVGEDVIVIVDPTGHLKSALPFETAHAAASIRDEEMNIRTK